jgi:hypothetical protein
MTSEEEMHSMEERCLALMKVDPDLQLPLQVDSVFPSFGPEEAPNLSVVMVPAIFELFSLYAEDKPPSALNVGNNAVLLGSNRERVDFGTFLLNAHKGRVGMTIDAFVKLACDFELIPKLLDLDEVEALCRISIRARRPVLVCGRRQGGSGGFSGGGGGGGGYGHSGSGANTLAPLTQGVEEQGSLRLQHPHFVDCLARCALVAYSVPPYSRDFESTVSRVEDFLCSNLGLLNQSETSGWRSKVGAVDRVGGHVFCEQMPMYKS